jgi:hypothetical protein
MDFILEHNEDPIPDPTSAAAATSSAQPIDVDDDEDTAALRAVYGTGPGAAAQADADAGVEARVRYCANFLCSVTYKMAVCRASNAQSAGRYSRTLHSPTSTLRKAGTTSSKSLPRRCV